MKQHHILIASTLKPVDDTRMFEKLAVSINKLTGFSVKIMGNGGKINSDLPIYGDPVFKFKRNAFLKRIFAPFFILARVIKRRPSVIILSTFELLIISPLLALMGIQVIYDVRENYRLNVSHSVAYSKVQKMMFKNWVKFNEWISRPFIKNYICAETIYLKQLPFLSQKGIIIENRLVKSNLPPSTKRDHSLWIFTGTVAKQTGIFNCMMLFKKYQLQFPESKLIIAGKCHIESLKTKLKAELNQITGVEILNDLNGVSHSEIIHLIQKAGIGFIGYENLPSISGKIPTKYYEYKGCGVPILLFHTPWLNHLISGKSGQIIHNLDSFDPLSMHHLIHQQIENDSHQSDAQLYWETHEHDLLTILPKS